MGLFTLKGLRCLQKADLIVYDFHVNPQILSYARDDAEFVYAGKRGGHHEMSQDAINRVLVERAREGKTICRLKGGDPFVFGRGGEEAEVLSREGIGFEVVPGISSAVAVPAYAGIPLTHRNYASSFAVITGSEAASKLESGQYWGELAKSCDTLVFLMGVKNIETITQKLVEHGLPAGTPAALIRWGTRPEQRTLVASVDQIARAARNSNMQPPAIMVVGKTVGLRDALKWYEEKPLFGHRILIAREYSPDYEPLEDLGAEVFAFPALRIVPPESFDEADRAIGQLEAYNWLIFTSANALRYFTERLLRNRKDVRDLKGLKICAIGAKTAQAVSRLGLRIDLVPDEFSAEGLVDAFASHPDAKSGFDALSFLLPRAAGGRELFPEKVRQLGGKIATPVVYRAVRPEKHGKRLQRFMSEGRITLAAFTSGGAFNNLFVMLGEQARALFKDVTIAALGPVTQRAIEKKGLTVSIVPPTATIPAMVEAIIRWAVQKH